MKKTMGFFMVFALLFAACTNPELTVDNLATNEAAVKISILDSTSRALHQVDDIAGYKIKVYLMESDQQTIVRLQHSDVYLVNEFPLVIERLSIGYAKFVIEAFDVINGDINVMAKGEGIKQLKQGINSITLGTTWVGTDTPQIPVISDEDFEMIEYDASASIGLSISVSNENYHIYFSRSDYYDPLEKTVRAKEPVTLGQNVYIGNNIGGDAIPISWRWMRSFNREPFQEISTGSGFSKAYLGTVEVDTNEIGVHYYYVEIQSDNGIRQQYQNSPLYKVRVLPPPPVYYRSPTGIGIITRNSNLIADENAVIASVGMATVIQKNKKAIVTFYVPYEDSGYVADPRTIMPTIESSLSVTVIDVDIDSKGVPVYYSCLIQMNDYGIGWLECSAGDYRLKMNIVCAEGIIKDGNWAGAGRLTHFTTPDYEVKSATAEIVHIVYLYGGQSMSNYDWSFIKAFINEDEEPVDTYWFTATSYSGSYTLHTPHMFEYQSNFQDTTLRFEGRSGDYTAYLGYVFYWLE